MRPKRLPGRRRRHASPTGSPTRGKGGGGRQGRGEWWLPRENHVPAPAARTPVGTARPCASDRVHARRTSAAASPVSGTGTQCRRASGESLDRSRGGTLSIPRGEILEAQYIHVMKVSTSFKRGNKALLSSRRRRVVPFAPVPAVGLLNCGLPLLPHSIPHPASTPDASHHPSPPLALLPPNCFFPMGRGRPFPHAHSRLVAAGIIPPPPWAAAVAAVPPSPPPSAAASPPPRWSFPRTASDDWPPRTSVPARRQGMAAALATALAAAAPPPTPTRTWWTCLLQTPPDGAAWKRRSRGCRR